MDRHHAVLAFALCAGLSLWTAGCGGQAGTPIITTPKASAQTALVQFTIVVPAPPSSKARRPAYVSSSTKSATITVTPGNISTTVNCTNVCSASIAPPLGTDTFIVNLYDGTNGTGNLLSTGTFTQTIVAGQNNAVNLTFNGVASSLAIALNPTSVTIGTPATPAVAVTVNALDADGNIIVGPGNYSNVNGNPLTLTLHDSDSSRATQLSVTTLTAPTSGITLSYNGASISNAIISVTAPGLTTAQATLTVNSQATPTPTPNPTTSPSPSSGLITYNASTACINHVGYANNVLPSGVGEFATNGLNDAYWGGTKTRTVGQYAGTWGPGYLVSWGRHQYDTDFSDPSDGLGLPPTIAMVSDTDNGTPVNAVRISAYPQPFGTHPPLALMGNDQWVVTSASAPFTVPAEGSSLTVNVANPNGAQNNWKVGMGYISGAAVTFIGTLTSGGATPSGNGTGGSNPWTISNIHIYAGSAGTTVTPGQNDEGGFRAYNFPAYYSGTLDLNLPIEYGFFVARLRLPKYAPALSPAFWTLQTGGVQSNANGLMRNEDDIMEMFGNTSGNALNAGQIHWNTSPSQFWPTPTGVYSWPLSGDPSTAYHDYGMLLANGSTTFYLDGTPISSHVGGPDWTNGTADKELMLMFQVSAPGSWLDPNSQGPSNKWPQYLWTQWIRVYQPTRTYC